jgi:hypothetical protein
VFRAFRFLTAIGLLGLVVLHPHAFGNVLAALTGIVSNGFGF